MFSRRAVLPIDLTIVQTEAEKVEMKEFDDEELDIEMQKQRKRLERVKENILVAQQRQKAQYDLKHSNPVVFQVGAIVLKKDFTRRKRKGGKMDLPWLGPYKIVNSLGRGLYRLEGIDDDKVISRVNGVHLKLYHQPIRKVCIFMLLDILYNVFQYLTGALVVGVLVETTFNTFILGYRAID